MPVNVNPINVPALAAYAGNRIGNLGLRGGGAGFAGGLASALGQMNKQRSAQQAQAEQYKQQQALQTQKLQSAQMMQQRQLAAAKGAREQKRELILKQMASEKAERMDKQQAEQRAAFSMMYLNSPEIQKDEEATKQYIEAGVKNGILNEDEAELFMKGNPGQRSTMLKMDLVTTGTAAKAINQKMKQRELDIMEGKQEPTTSTKSTTQKALLSLQKDYKALQEIEKDFDPEFLTYKGKIKKGVSQFAEKAEGIPIVGDIAEGTASALTGMSKEQRSKYIQQGTRLLNSTEQFFMRYRKQITGAQAALKELAELRKSFISGDMSPSQFKAALDTIKRNALRDMEFYQESLREGVDVSDSEYSQADLEYTAKKHGMSVKEVKKRLGAR